MEVYAMFFWAFVYLAHQKGNFVFELLRDAYKPGSQILQSTNHLKAWVLRIVEQLKVEDQRDMKKVWLDIVEQVQDYVHVHLSEDISLQSIAEHVFLHPVYLSKVYKEKTGEGLSDYIVRIKMEHAAGLLHTLRDRKVYEIADQLGFKNSSYFSKVFKNRYGMTPLEYRKSYKTTLR